MLLSGLKRRRSSSSPTDASELPDEDAGNVRFDLVDVILLVEGDEREAFKGPAGVVRTEVLVNLAVLTRISEAGRAARRVDSLIDSAPFQGGSAWAKALLDTAGDDGSRVGGLRFGVPLNGLIAGTPSFLTSPAILVSLTDLGVMEPISRWSL